MTREIQYRQALNEAMFEEMHRDPLVLTFGEGIAERGGSFRVTEGLLAEFGGDRVKDTPISESIIAGAAVGAAIVGTRPVAEILFVDFVALSMDQIVNQAAKYRFMVGGHGQVPMVLRTQGGSGKGLAAQHSQSLEAWFCHVPGLKVVMPSTPYDAKGLLKTAIRDNDPVIFLEQKLLYFTSGPVPEEEYTIPFGQADVKRAGTDLTIVAWSFMVSKALEAAEKLASEGIDVELIDPRTLVPLDTDAICTSVQKTHRLLIVHEACKRGGFGGEIAARVMERCFDDLDAPITRVAGKNTPMPFNIALEQASVPQVADIVTAARALCS